MKAKSLILAALIGFAPAAIPGFALAAPQAPKTSATKLQAPLPLPYDEAADAQAAVKATIAKAKASGKYVLIDLGGNWCPDCRTLAAVFELPEVAAALKRDFELVNVDVGRFNKNLDIGQAYGVTVKAAPTMIVLDPSGKFVNAGNPTALSNARAMTPQAMVDTIWGWATAH